ncbi:polymorphic toxin type 17 domain-containing protein [Oleidesulfovibrio sp.]|uniref:polymorphic toxin type 17 domain-containing protein n=1 Tax=Oleidesulfovibrio sp. TaxID=2909707 RepID=UPI003A84275D
MALKGALHTAIAGATVGTTAGATTGAASAAVLKGALHTAISAGFNSLVTQATVQLVANKGDVGAAMQGLVSSETIRSLATTMLTAGLTQGLLDFANVAQEPGILSQAKSLDEATKILQAEVLRTAIRTSIGASVDTAVNGGKLEEKALANLKVAAAASIGAQGAKTIGIAFHDGDIDTATKYIAHAALGGVLGEITSGDATSGAVGAVVGEFTGTVLAAEIKEALKSGEVAPDTALRWKDAGVDFSKLAAGLVAASIGGDIDVAADAGGNAAKNNAAQVLAAGILVLGAAGAAGLAAMQEAIDHGITSVGEVLRQVNLAAMGDSRQIVAYIALLYEALPDEVKEGMKLPGYTIPDSGPTILSGQEIKEDKGSTKLVHNIPEPMEPLSGYPDQSGERGKEDYIITADNASKGGGDVDPAPSEQVLYPDETLSVGKVWTKNARIKDAQLPTSGRIRYVPPKNWDGSTPLPRGPNKGYVDKFGNEWTRGPSRTQGQAFEWDVQLSKTGKSQIGWTTRDGSHANVSLDGKITHQ